MVWLVLVNIHSFLLLQEINPQISLFSLVYVKFSEAGDQFSLKRFKVLYFMRNLF